MINSSSTRKEALVDAAKRAKLLGSTESAPSVEQLRVLLRKYYKDKATVSPVSSASALRRFYAQKPLPLTLAACDAMVDRGGHVMGVWLNKNARRCLRWLVARGAARIVWDGNAHLAAGDDALASAGRFIDFADRHLSHEAYALLVQLKVEWGKILSALDNPGALPLLPKPSLCSSR